MFLLYKTDNQHSYGSRDLIGVCTTKEITLKLCRKKAKLEGHKIEPDQLFNLQTLNQTQGYFGEGEFDIEEVEKNILL